MRKYSMLLVDDDPLVTGGMGSHLEKKGYAVTAANSGEEALEWLDKSIFDLVITALVMGPTNGIDVLKRAKEVSPEIMVIILTEFGDLSSAIDALRFDADDYLLKPCEPEEMYFRVSRCLEKSEFKRKIRSFEQTLPVCSVCKKIRDDTGRERGTGEWLSIESYMRRRAKVDMTSTYCPDCYKRALEKIDREFLQ